MSHAAAEILVELQRRGVIVAVEGDTLCLKPKRVLDDTLARNREVKLAILNAPVKASIHLDKWGSVLFGTRRG